mmetsp:Transcript_59297/g.134255  ORF Transcript_59297/g.134255 Transcript_59297/m.134255 type:complete len:249 (+) Transcript_59297:608-1354(+)
MLRSPSPDTAAPKAELPAEEEERKVRLARLTPARASKRSVTSKPKRREEPFFGETVASVTDAVKSKVGFAVGWAFTSAVASGPSSKSTVVVLAGALFGVLVASLFVGSTWVGFGSASGIAGPGAFSLQGPNPLRLQQGDTYHEPGLVLSKELQAHITSKQLPAPSVSYEYSEAGMAFSDYLEGAGSFEVLYTVEAPYLEGRKPVKLQRSVVVADVDECTYQGDLAQFKHTCGGARPTCRNTVGSFECV